jgi:hypothetical protein
VFSFVIVALGSGIWVHTALSSILEREVGEVGRFVVWGRQGVVDVLEVIL